MISITLEYTPKRSGVRKSSGKKGPTAPGRQGRGGGPPSERGRPTPAPYQFIESDSISTLRGSGVRVAQASGPALRTSVDARVSDIGRYGTEHARISPLPPREVYVHYVFLEPPLLTGFRLLTTPEKSSTKSSPHPIALAGETVRWRLRQRNGRAGPPLWVWGTTRDFRTHVGQAQRSALQESRRRAEEGVHETNGTKSARRCKRIG